MMNSISYIILLSVALTSCKSAEFIRNKEAREDAKKMAEAIALQQAVPHQLIVDVETAPVSSAEREDAADDPAIWYNKANPEKSIIIGTNKVSGLYTYDLMGQEIDYSASGKMNNVDVRDGFPFQNRSIVLVGATNRTTQGISLFELFSNGTLSEKIGEIKTNVDDVYGFTLRQNGTAFYAISNGKNGVIEQFLLQEENGKLIGKKTAEASVALQPEGMTVLDNENTLFIGVEEQHIEWFTITDSGFSKAKVLPQSSAKNNAFIAYDIEGLANFTHNNKRYLIASIQGSFSYAIYHITNLQTAEYITSFSLQENIEKGVDGVEETDGLEVLAAPLGKQFPNGILVVQDGFNYDGEELQNQNFKVVDLRKVIALLP